MQWQMVHCSDKWYEHSPKSVEENEEVKLLWDFTIQTDREIQAGHLEQLGIKNRTRTMQKSALLGSAHILRKVLEFWT